MNRFSIILPVRNGGSYVKQCVHSILSQSLVYFNLIVLDNCSTDGTLEWLRSLQDERLVLYPSAVPLSIEENWRRITTVPKNEFMTMIGHDDVLLPNYLETMDKLIEKHPTASLYQTHFSYIDANGAFMRPCLPMDERQHAHEFLAFHLRQMLDSMGTGYMFRAKDYDALGGIPDYPDLIFADYELWIRLAAISYKATAFNNGFCYRLHQSLSSTTKGSNYQQSFHRYILYIKTMADKEPTFKKVIERHFMPMLYFYCEKIAHRLLKTPRKDGALKVAAFVELCRSYVGLLVPGQIFAPEKKRPIALAIAIDNNPLLRTMFLAQKKIGRRKINIAN